MEVWKYQYNYNLLYHDYCDLLNINPLNVREIGQIPFLPIVLFREHEIKTGHWTPEKAFKSSGTTGSIQSQHLMRSLEWYHQIANLSFTSFFKSPDGFTWLGLLPSYMERPDSSLVDMVNYFMSLSHKPENKFFPAIDFEIMDTLHQLQLNQQPTILIGVSFALLDLFEKNEVPFWDDLLVMETGGMKGRRQELTREELYERIRRQHPNLKIASEYGMTELTSQAYKKDLHFLPGPTMKVYTRDISDPFIITDDGQRGVINIIDLGNLDTCSFIATDDIGMTYPDGSFDVMGRLDQSDIRGCNLLYT